MTDLVYAPAHVVASQIAAREISAIEVVSAAIGRAEAVQPRVNCIAIPLYEEALAAARAADARQARGEALGPLHGVPITIKDGVATAGHVNSFGSASRQNDIAAADDIVWQRLKAAGAILIGKTTAPEFFHRITTDSPLYGVTRNPWSLAHSPGGSSGGAAAALAAGVGALAVGSDGGGSLRCPAAWTATVAIKPTMGRVPHGSFSNTFSNYSMIGPMARNVRDLSTMLDVMAGPAAADAASIGRTVVAHDAARRLRIGVLRLANVDVEVERLTDAAIGRLAESGAEIVEVDGSILDGAFDCYRVISSVGQATRLRTTPAAAQALWTESFRALVAEGVTYSAVDYEVAQQRRTGLFRAIQALFETIDVLASPVSTTPPLVIDAESSVGSDAYAVAAAALYPFNLTGHPALSAPCGFTGAGLPVGLQLVAPWYHEARLLALAARLEPDELWDGRRPEL